MSSSFVEALRQTLPPTFSRSVAADALKGVFSAGRLATLDSKGEGPGGVRIGRVVAYERESFLRWLESRMDTPAMVVWSARRGASHGPKENPYRAELGGATGKNQG